MKELAEIEKLRNEKRWREAALTGCGVLENLLKNMYARIRARSSASQRNLLADIEKNVFGRPIDWQSLSLDQLIKLFAAGEILKLVQPAQGSRRGQVAPIPFKKLGEIRMEARAEVAQTLKQMNEDMCNILTDRQERIWKRSFERLQRGLRPGPGGPGRRGEGPGGMRLRRGRQDRRELGPYGPWRRPGGPNIPRDASESNSSEVGESPIMNER